MATKKTKCPFPHQFILVGVFVHHIVDHLNHSLHSPGPHNHDGWVVDGYEPAQAEGSELAPGVGGDQTHAGAPQPQDFGQRVLLRLVTVIGSL